MKTPKISVIMAVYNSGKYLDESVTSILNQTFKDFEFIIVNDGSTDGSLEIVHRYQKKDKRIIFVNNKKNIGPAGSRNIGIKMAKGKYIAILDADDIALENRLRIQYKYLERNENIFLVGGGAIKIDEKGRETMLYKPIIQEGKLKKTLAQITCCIHNPTIMFRNEKKWFYREKFRYAHDYDLFLNLLSKEKKMVNLPDFLIKYREHSQSITLSKKAKQMLFVKKAKGFYLQRVKYGKDEYDEFDSDEILGLDTNKSTDKLVLKAEIEGNFKLNRFKKARKILKKYFKYHGFSSRFIIYYFATFMGKGVVNRFRKFRWGR